MAIVQHLHRNKFHTVTYLDEETALEINQEKKSKICAMVTQLDDVLNKCGCISLIYSAFASHEEGQYAIMDKETLFPDCWKSY